MELKQFSNNSIFKLKEICKLAESIEINATFSKVLKLKKPTARLFLSSGLVEEIKSYIENNHIDLLIINNSISPVQQRNLEIYLKIKVIDRTHLILEIFGSRAKTFEGNLQVELAHFIYQRSRLIRTWTH